MVRSMICSLIFSLLLITQTGITYSQQGNGNTDSQNKESSKKIRPEVTEALETLYPVPIKRGESVNLQYIMPEEGKLKFQVTDFEGEKHFGFAESFEAGNNNISFNTSGLEVGNYIVELTSPTIDKEKSIMLTVVR